ncbi:MAG: polysaccharide biosynthesis tyrosine autokinase [Clostridiales bacterium]|nr:polysaccharide biosynthesis tyrosine autokinase [Clostridiales bacterium]
MILAAIAGFGMFAVLALTLSGGSATVSASLMIVNNLSTDGSVEAEYQKTVTTDGITKNSIAILTSSDLVKRAMEAEKIRGDASAFLSGMKVEQIADSHVLRITVRHSKGETAAAFANRLAQIGCDEIQRRYTEPPVTASVMDRAVAPVQKTNYIAVGIVGLFGILCAVLAFLVSIYLMMLRGNAIRNFRRYCEIVEKPLLGTVSSGKSMTRLEKQGSTRESMRIVRSVLKHKEHSAQVILVCSAGSMQGKTMVAAGLAQALSESSGRVLLMDANMHEPNVRSLLRVDSTYGLADILTGKSSLQQAMVPANSDTLYVISAASTYVENPSALLESDSMRELLQKLRSAFDYIVIDAPYVNKFADAAALAEETDCCILCARYARTRVQEASLAIDTLQNAGGHVSGIVAVGVPELSKKE